MGFLEFYCLIGLIIALYCLSKDGWPESVVDFVACIVVIIMCVIIWPLCLGMIFWDFLQTPRDDMKLF